MGVRQSLTWEKLVELEPRLGELLLDIQQIKDDKTAQSFCGNRNWYGRWNGRHWTSMHSFRERMADLVGSEAGYDFDADRDEATEDNSIVLLDCSGPDKKRKHKVHKLLLTHQAYNLAYQKLYRSLPDCRNCRCMPSMITDDRVKGTIYERKVKTDRSTP